jgi:hypothetical protein
MAENGGSKIGFAWVVAAVLLPFPLYFLFDHFGRPGNGRAAWFCATVIFLAVKFRWELHKKKWFWPTVVAIVLAHLPLILYVPWTSNWVPSFLIFPLCLVDFVVTLILIHQVEKRMKPARAPKELGGQ